MSAREPLRLMAVLAHPDDESLGTGGLIAKYVAEGVEVFLVTATRGESGRYLEHRSGPEHPGPERLAEIREAELRAAAEVLGVQEVSLLGYRDGVLDQADPLEVIGRIAGHLRRVRPQVVVTFAQDGGYGHPDHIAICQFATAATVAAADPAHRSPETEGRAPHAIAKLYYMASPPEEWERYQSAFKRLVSRVDGVERVANPWPEWGITTVVDTRAQWRTVWRAVQCHRTQVASYGRLRELTDGQLEDLWGTEYLYRAFSTVNGGRARESDVFEGLR